MLYLACTRRLRPMLETTLAQAHDKMLGVPGPKRFWLLWRMTQKWIFRKTSLTEILFYGKENPDNVNNASRLDATIKSLIETKRFDVQLFWFSTDVMALILILLWIFIFSLFSCFVLFLLLSFYYFHLFVGISTYIWVNVNIYKRSLKTCLKNYEVSATLIEKFWKVLHYIM